ncbi:MAG: homoserine kinase, partial [Bdellovibrionales bacterium]|nr:homoserine kinase [Bdellovibrionales bacterium]
MTSRVTAFAPATVANITVGFDSLGLCLDHFGDRVTIEKSEATGVSIQEIEGTSVLLPLDPAKNTATLGVLSLYSEQSPDFGLRVSIKKGLPIGSGLGSSACSSVAGVCAAARLIAPDLSKEDLLSYCLEGEALAHGVGNADNIAPCLLGGMVFVAEDSPLRLLRLKVPASLWVTVFHQDVFVPTEKARALLPSEVSTRTAVLQSRRLAEFLLLLERGSLRDLSEVLEDYLAEPYRKNLIPHFEEFRIAARDAGAFHLGISG